MRQLEKKKHEMELNNSPLGTIFNTSTEQPISISHSVVPSEEYCTDNGNTVHVDNLPFIEETPLPKLRTDDVIYKKFGEKEKSVINTIYSAIYNAIADEAMREGLIRKIEKELTK